MTEVNTQILGRRLDVVVTTCLFAYLVSPRRVNNDRSSCVENWLTYSSRGRKMK